MKIRQSAAFLFLILTGVSRAAPVIHTDFKPAQHPLLILVKGYSVTAVGVGLNDDNGSTDPGGNESTDPGGNESTDPGGNESTDPGGNESTDPGGNESTDPGGNEGT